MENPEPERPPKLGEIVKQQNLETLLGDWVDQGTKGEFRVSLKWKIKDELLELTTVDQAGPSIASIAVDVETGEIMFANLKLSGQDNSFYYFKSFSRSQSVTESKLFLGPWSRVSHALAVESSVVFCI